MPEPLRPIFLADDEADDEFLIRHRLRKTGPQREVVSFKDGADLVDFMEGEIKGGRSVAGLLLLDLKMPRLDGFDALRWIREQEALSQLNVVVITSSQRPEDSERALAIGARRVMVKFPSVEDLAGVAMAFA